MTRLEKVKELHPDWTDDAIMDECPEDILPVPSVECIENCEECWKAEFEEGEQV